MAIGLDANADGEIQWGEVKAKHNEISRYARSRLVILTGSQGTKERTSNVIYDAGVIFELTPKIALRAELAQTEKYSDLLPSQNSRIDTYTIGFHYRF